jgi:hypothetical protein
MEPSRRGPHPYRDAPPIDVADETPERELRGLHAALKAAELFLLLWALWRVALCTIHGLDFEGLIGLVIVAVAGQSLVHRRRDRIKSSRGGALANSRERVRGLGEAQGNG